MNLIRAELERLGARRFVQLMIVLLMLAFGVTAATTLAGSHQPSAVELAEAQRQAAANLRGMELEHERCLARDRGEPLPGDEGFYLPPDCSELDPALRDRLPVAADYLTGVFTFTRQAEPLLYFLVAYLVLFGFLVGASYIGADLNSGGVVNLLLWRPRRLTVLGAKLGTLLGAVLTVSVLASLAYLVTFWVIAQVAGYPGPTNAAFWADLGAIWGRGLTLVLLAAATGFAIATMGRHTAAALGAVAAYLVVWELGGRIVLQILEVARPDQLMLASYVGAWLAGEVRFWDSTACRTVVDSYCDGSYTLTWQPALAVLLLLTAGLSASAFAIFRRRDLI
ncbi:ABC transporter permease subunit [Verrucosispora sp. WMMA2044]|uniref:ABC transporter permease subunit n=1 Tax=Verrucosispora sioxanthis TaxID=2499994 RepID=A0A6M1L1L8_9ACTN|nr:MULTISPECIES: ABC transporter permease subunit [Micromonospora]NEE62877.1 ABC transporter permease subunit [Verrucosispora sioxanthis]NGM11987.1 ABC transporter permease subunit [Verrucosispora sioxanthis]WBB47249.1 ABC transporter permease subunit [Verrucosispora sp. WMMA2044]